MVKSPGRLRATARIAVLIGAVGSAGFLLRAGQRTPPLLLVIMSLWVLSPFVAIAWADAVSKHWPVFTRAGLYGVTLAIALTSLAVYAHNAVRPRTAQAGFVFVVVPLISWVLMAIVLPIVALISCGLARRATPPG